MNLGLEVAAARRRGLAAATAEDGREDVAEVGGEGAGATPAPTEAPEEPAGVVLLALVGVGERVVGLLDVFETLLGSGVVRIAIRVVLAGQLAVGLLDLVGARLPPDAKDLVEVARHRGLLFGDDHPRRADDVVCEAIARGHHLEHRARLGAVAGLA